MSHSIRSKKFQTLETQLIDELRRLCDNKGKEKNPEAAADIFNQMGLLYKTKSPDKISLLQSVALLNAALTRQPDNSKFKNDLTEMCNHVLHCAKAKQKKCLLKISCNVRKQIDVMRTNVKQNLMKIIKILDDAEASERLLKEQENVKQVYSTQNILSRHYKRIMASISEICFEIMGRPPCKYALVGMGSLAREEVSPYSDFEHIVVLENCHSKKKKRNTTNIKEYFRWYSVIFHVIVLNLQETILPAMCIPGLNDSSTSNGNWFYDGITTRGISFDGMMPHACKFPLGRTTKTKNKPFTTELIKPINEMVKYLTTEEDLKNGYKLSEVLTQTCFVEGDEDVYGKFSNKAKQVIKEHCGPSLLSRQLNEDLENFSLIKNLKNFMFKKSINIKRIVYRSMTLFISALARLYNVDAASSFEIINKLKSSQTISDEATKILSHAVAVACHIRLSHYMSTKQQDDNIYRENEYRGMEKLKELTKFISQECLVKCLVTAFVLQILLQNNTYIGDFDNSWEQHKLQARIHILNHLGLHQHALTLCNTQLAQNKTQHWQDVFFLYQSLTTYVILDQDSKIAELLKNLESISTFRLEDHPMYNDIKFMELGYLCNRKKFPEVVHGSEAILRSNLSTLQHKGRFHYLIGRAKYNLKDYRGALNTFKNKAWNCVMKEDAIHIISLSLIAIGHQKQGVHWAREGRNLLDQLDATEELREMLNFSHIISTCGSNRISEWKPFYENV